MHGGHLAQKNMSYGHVTSLDVESCWSLKTGSMFSKRHSSAYCMLYRKTLAVMSHFFERARACSQNNYYVGDRSPDPEAMPNDNDGKNF